MAVIDLPPLPRGSSISPKVLRFGGDLTSQLGGPTTRISRLGSRYAIDVSLPTMDLDCARTWIAKRAQAEAEGATLRLTLPQFGDASAVVGRTATAGAGANMTLSSGAGVAVGFWFSFVKSGHTYLHQITQLAGAAAHVAPLLRVSPAGLALEFAAPKVEGFVDELAWSVERLRFVGQSFTLTEDR